MKFIYIFLLALITICISCDRSNTASKHKMEKQNTNGPEYTSQYICPMHCKGSGSDQPGTCPVCQMDYEKNENLK